MEIKKRFFSAIDLHNKKDALQAGLKILFSFPFLTA